MVWLMATIGAHWPGKIWIEGGKSHPRLSIQWTGTLRKWSESSIVKEKWFWAVIYTVTPDAKISSCTAIISTTDRMQLAFSHSLWASCLTTFRSNPRASPSTSQRKPLSVSLFGESSKSPTSSPWRHPSVELTRVRIRISISSQGILWWLAKSCSKP